SIPSSYDSLRVTLISGPVNSNLGLGEVVIDGVNEEGIVIDGVNEEGIVVDGFNEGGVVIGGVNEGEVVGDDGVENQNDDEYNLDDDDNWIPDPVDAGPEYKSSIYRLADMTNLLISLFDNTELLTEEIQRQMAECLLLKTDFNTTKELAKLELFKLRFGESKMSTVEVMVKDISDSKRINGNIYNNNERLIRKNAAESSDLEIILNNENEILYTSILSRLFWPTINNEEFEVPPPISDEMKTYNNAFQSLKPRRKLNWLPSLGKVQLELEFQGKTLEMEVEPVHATIIYHFQEK
ncbi:1354_t:CDS:2, partial [Entrophospora sp. SA101]